MSLLWMMQWTGILLSIPWITLVVYLLYRWYKSNGIVGNEKHIFTMIFLLKIIAAFAVQALYTYYYTDRATADIYRFFDDGLILKDIFFEAPTDFFKIMIGAYDADSFRSIYFDRMNAWIKPFDSGLYNDNHTMIRLNALLAFISFGYYEVHSVIITSCVFLSMLAMSRALFREKSLEFMIVLSIFPGVLLWTSGVLKESLLVIGLCLMLYALFQNRIQDWFRFLLLIISAVILTLIKPYFLLAFVPAYLIYQMIRNLRRGNRIQLMIQWPLWISVYALLFILMAASDINPLEAIAQKRNDFVNHAMQINSGSLISTAYLDSDIQSFILHAPDALANTLLRPYPHSLRSAPEVLMLFENVLLVVLLVWVVWKFRKEMTKKQMLRSFIFLQTAIPIVFLIGYTTPVLGAIMRYRAPVLILLIIFAFHLIPQKRISQA